MDLPLIGGAMPAAAAKDKTATDRRDAAAHKGAEAFEAAFLAEMLQYTGINANPAGFGGGAGEDAFSSFLTQEYARLLAKRGGIGIAERVFDILKQRTGA